MKRFLTTTLISGCFATGLMAAGIELAPKVDEVSNDAAVMFEALRDVPGFEEVLTEIRDAKANAKGGVIMFRNKPFNLNPVGDEEVSKNIDVLRTSGAANLVPALKAKMDEIRKPSQEALAKAEKNELLVFLGNDQPCEITANNAPSSPASAADEAFLKSKKAEFTAKANNVFNNAIVQAALWGKSKDMNTATKQVQMKKLLDMIDTHDANTLTADMKALDEGAIRITALEGKYLEQYKGNVQCAFDAAAQAAIAASGATGTELVKQSAGLVGACSTTFVPATLVNGEKDAYTSFANCHLPTL